MNLVASGAGVSTRLCVATRADHGNTKGDEPVAQFRGLARGKDQSDVGQEQSKSADELDEVAITHVSQWLEFTGAWTQTGQGNGQLRFPAVAKEIVRMRRDCDCFCAPVSEAEECTDTKSTKACRIGAFGSFQTPVKIPLWSGCVHVCVNLAIVSFLIDNQAIRAGFDQRSIFVCFHWAELKRDAGNLGVEGANAFREVTIGNKFGMLARNQQEISKTLSFQRARFAEYVVHCERDAKNRIVARESTVFAIIDALVGEIKGRE